MNNYIKLKNTWIQNVNNIPATYGNVSLYSQAKADLNQINTTNLAIGKDNDSNYNLDVSGNIRLRGTITLNSNNIAYDNDVVHKTGNETINSQKTFYLNYSDLTITNPYMRDFNNNGFTVPPSHGSFTSMITQVGSYNFLYSGWRFVSGSGTNNNLVRWWYGSGSSLEWWQTTCIGAAPNLNNPSNPIQSSTFTGNYALSLETFAPTQSFYLENNVSITEGIYILSFFSFWGSSPFGGGHIGSTTASITVSFNGNVSQTYKYADPETRSQVKWKLHKVLFIVPSGSTATYIRWTPNETQSSVHRFRWAIAGLSIRKYNGQRFQDGTSVATIAGSISYIENPYLNNPVALNTLTCAGIPSFNATTGASNLVLNTEWNTSANNVSNIAIGYGLASGTSYTNNVLLGFQNGGGTTSLVESVLIGTGVSAYYRDVLIGAYLRSNQGSGYLGSNVVIGSFIGRDVGATRQPTAGCSQRCVAIGSEIFSSYNGFGRNPLSPTEAISIGYRSQNLCWDNYNTCIGCYSLENIRGNNLNTLTLIKDICGNFIDLRRTQYNVALGHSSGKGYYDHHNLNRRFDMANRCVFLGAATDYTMNDISNSIAIGYGALVGANYATSLGSYVFNDKANSVKIGRDVDTTYIDGKLSVSGYLYLPINGISDVHLSNNIPLKNGINIFSGSNTFNILPQSSNDPINNNDLVRKQWVESQLSGKHPLGDYVTIDTSQNIIANKNFLGNNIFSGSNTFNNPIRNGSVMPLKGCTTLFNNITKTHVLNPSNWTEIYVLSPSNTSTDEMYNITLPTITSDMVGAQLIIYYQPIAIQLTLTQYTTIQCPTSGMIFPEELQSPLQSIQTFRAPLPTGGGQTNQVYYTIIFTATNGTWLATHTTYYLFMKNTWSFLQTFNTGITISDGGTITLPTASIADRALTTNIPRKDVSNNFTQLNIFSVCPQTTAVPTQNNDLIRKVYADNNYITTSTNQSIGGLKTFTNSVVIKSSTNNGAAIIARFQNNATNDRIVIYDEGGPYPSTGPCAIRAAGSLGMALVAEQGTLYCFSQSTQFGVGLTANATSWVQASDIRLKHKISNIENELDNICKLRPVYYNFKGDTNDFKPRVGFIAQEVEQIYPNLINDLGYRTEIDDNVKALSIETLVPYMVKAIQEQQQTITNLSNELSDLKNILKSKNII